MSSPHVAGGAALVLEARPKTQPQCNEGAAAELGRSEELVRQPGLGFLDYAFRQGAGMLDIVGAVNATTKVEPSEIALGESEGGAKTFTVTVSNENNSPVTYALSHVAGVAAGPNTMTGASYNISGTFNAPATVTFSAPSVAVSADGSASFDVTIDANAGAAEPRAARRLRGADAAGRWCHVPRAVRRLQGRLPEHGGADADGERVPVACQTVGRELNQPAQRRDATRWPTATSRTSCCIWITCRARSCSRRSTP